MEKRNLLLSLVLLVIITLPVYADTLEQVRMVKFWDLTDDMIIERETGEKLLIQHHKACSSMNTEFPLQLVWNGEKVTQVKVAANEICDVYNFGPYSSELKIVKRIESTNSLVPAHQATAEWHGGLYEIDYSDGCVNLRDFENSTAYLYTPESVLIGATLYLPKARGQCTLNKATLIQTLDTVTTGGETMVKNLKIQSENNQAFFSWDAFPENEIWIALVTYSKFPFNPAEFDLTQMPNLKRTRASSLRVLGLVNNQKYYFYIASSNGKDKMSVWQSVEVTPAKTARVLVNQPDPDPFEIKMQETDNAFTMTWPDKSEHSRRYMIQLYVDGGREIFKLVDTPEFIIEKRPEWASSRFRMTVRSIPIKPTGMRYFDSIFWRKG